MTKEQLEDVMQEDIEQPRVESEELDKIESVKLDDDLQKFFREIKLTNMRPSPLVTELFHLPPEEISNADMHTLNTYLIALGQYIVYMRYRYNLTKIKLNKMLRAYNTYIYRKASNMTGRGLTVKEKIARVESTDETAKRYSAKVLLVQSYRDSLDEIVDNLLEYNNNIKKVHDQRREEKRIIMQERNS